MDLPLPERDQLRVMKVLAQHCDDYESIGTVYTRASGKERVVEIELGFPCGMPIGEIAELGAQMQAALAGESPHLALRVIPTAA
jgi:hypothetical protein